MSETICTYEERVAAAAAAGPLPPELASHLAGCAGCRGAARAVEWLGRAGVETRRVASPPPVRQLWRRAVEARRAAALRRATRILRLAQAIAVLAALALAPALASVGWGSLWQSTASFGSLLPSALAAGLQAGGALLAVVAAGATAMVYGLYARWAGA